MYEHTAVHLDSEREKLNTEVSAYNEVARKLKQIQSQSNMSYSFGTEISAYNDVAPRKPKQIQTCWETDSNLLKFDLMSLILSSRHACSNPQPQIIACESLTLNPSEEILSLKLITEVSAYIEPLPPKPPT